MEKNVLKDFETFYEFPNKYIKVTCNSNYYYIKINNHKFITKKNIDLLCSDNGNIELEESYYSIIDGNFVLKTKNNIYRISEYGKETEDNVLIQPLYKILNISGNGVYYLDNHDIDGLINYKEECAKTYGLEPRKYYF